MIYLIPEGKDISKSPRCIKAFTLHEMDELEEHLLKYDKAHAKGEFRYDVEPKEGGEDE